MTDQRADPSRAARLPQRVPLGAYLELMRLPNLGTAAADGLMGLVLAQTAVAVDRWPPWLALRLTLLVACSCLLYTAGIVLNDVSDARVDARERPQRPIPSGRVGRDAARRVGWALWGLGTVAGGIAGILLASPGTAIVALGLALCVLLYNGPAKRTAVGPVIMGSCRMLNVLLGMSLSSAPWDAANWLVVAGIGTYVAGVTWLARAEGRVSRRSQLALATLVLLAGLALIAWLPAWREHLAVPDRWWLFWALLAALIGWRCLRAILMPVPTMVQRAVGNAIQALIVIDAAICLAVQQTAWALAIVALLLPTLWLRRRFPTT